jgi:hypothetical protein
MKPQVKFRGVLDNASENVKREEESGALVCLVTLAWPIEVEEGKQICLRKTGKIYTQNAFYTPILPTTVIVLTILYTRFASYTPFSLLLRACFV